jgi:hypothetical protein
MPHTRLIARKSTSHQPSGQFAPRDMPQPQEPQHDSPPHTSQEEEPFEIELVVTGSLAAQGAPAEEQQQDHDIDNEDEDDEEYSPLSDNEGEKLYRDADKRLSFGVEAPVPTVGFMLCWDTWAAPLPQDIGSRESHIQGRWNSRLMQRSSPGPGSSAGIRGQPSEHLSMMLWLTQPGRPSLLGVVIARMSCRTPSITSILSERRANSRPLG